MRPNSIDPLPMSDTTVSAVIESTRRRFPHLRSDACMCPRGRPWFVDRTTA